MKNQNTMQWANPFALARLTITASAARQLTRSWRTCGIGVRTPQLAVFFAITAVMTFMNAAFAAPANLVQTVTYNGETVTMQLTKENLRGEHFELWAQNATGTYDVVAPVDERSYIGTVDEYPGAVSFGILQDDGIFKGGVIFDRGDFWYTLDDAVYSSTWVAQPASFGYPGWTVAAGHGGTTTYGFDLGVDADYDYFNVRGGGSVAKAFEAIELSNSQVRALYMQNVLLRPYLARVIIRTDQLQDPANGLQGGTYLDAVRIEWETNQTDANRDVVSGVTASDVGGGLAWVGVIATSSAYSVSDSNADGDFSAVFRHELGHNWGMGHYMGGAPEAGTIMSNNHYVRMSGPEAANALVQRDARLWALDDLGTYSGVNMPPYAAIDGLPSKNEGLSQTVDVLANDYDANGHSLSILSFDTQTYLGGTVERSVGTGPGGRDELIYTSPLGSAGATDSFTYVVQDSSGQTATGAVAVNPLEEGLLPATVSAVSSENVVGIDRDSDHTVDSSGLWGGGNSGSSHDDGEDGVAWTTVGSLGPGTDYDPSITYDLGSLQDVVNMRVWNYNSSYVVGETNISIIGPDQVDVYTSVNGVDFTFAETVNFAQAPGASSYTGQDIAVNYTGVRYIKFDIMTNHDGAVFDGTGTQGGILDGRSMTGLSEVRFSKWVNSPPVFANDPINAPDALENVAYTGQTLAGEATDPNVGDVLTYSKLSGPAWLLVAANGTLSGTPSTGDLGSNVFTILVDDGNGRTDEATLNIDVVEAGLIHPTVYAVSSENVLGIDRDADHTVDSSGLSGGGSAGSTHADGEDAIAWTTVGSLGPGTDYDPYITYDLGSVSNVTTMRIWNYNSSVAVGGTNISIIGPDQVDVYTSVNGIDFTFAETVNFAQAPGTDGYTGQDITVNYTGVRYIKFDIMTTHDGAVFDGSGAQGGVLDGRSLTGLSEVRFGSGAVNNAPVANDATFAVAEDVVISSAVGSVSATDSDAGDTLSYAITAGNTGNAFAIDNSGNITTAAGLDFETTASYTLTVEVTDSGSLADTAAVTVTVTDVVETTAPVVATGSASNIAMTTADLGYSITDDGGEAPSVTLYYGETDGGTTPGNWTNSVAVGAKATGAYTESLTGLTKGTNYFFTIAATNSVATTWGSTASFATTADTSPKMVRTTVNSVSSTNWTTVDLGQNYTSAVIVATPIYADSTQVPVVTRIRNVSGSSFDLKLDRADGLTADVTCNVSVVAVEEGVYTLATDGVQMEAVKYTSTITAENNSWNAEARTYQNSYTTPVVVGQVMSANDANWSTFWSMGSSRLNPADASNLNVGKHVGEDPNATRANETIGYIVIESGNGTINGVAYTAAVGSDIVRNYENSASGYSYSLTGLTSASAAALSSTAMDGTDGAWPVLNGVDALSASTVKLIVDEDQLKDSEQKHATEQINYIIFE